MGPNPSAANVGNVLTAAAIVFDKEIIPNLKGETSASMELMERRVQPLNAGINRTFYQYQELGANTVASQDGVVGSPVFVGQLTSSAVIGEWNDYTNFSSFAIAAAIDELVGNSGIELSYRAAQSLAKLNFATLDSAATTDSNVNQSSLLSSPFTLDLGTFRSLKQRLVSIGVGPCKGPRYCSAMAPNVLGDIWNGTTVNNAAIDFWKYTSQGQDKFDRMASADQKAEIELPGTGIVIYQTPFVTTTSNYQSSGKTAYRNYVAGRYAGISVWLQVPGDVNMEEGDWKTIETEVVSDAPASAFDPTRTIGGWCAYKFHQVSTLIPATGANSQRLRFVDSVPAIQ